MTLLDSIRMDPIMDVAERAGRGRAFYEIFPGTPASDGWLLDHDRTGRPDDPAGDAGVVPAFSGADHDDERKAA